MGKIPTDKKSVEAAVAALQEKLADGDPSDAELRKSCDAALAGLRASYRANPAAFSKETIEALQELKALLADAGQLPEP
ncbi:MAG: hypothetical protein WC943_02460 [Elusimicrobiota bacterium]|jgi:hypothetical protein